MRVAAGVIVERDHRPGTIGKGRLEDIGGRYRDAVAAAGSHYFLPEELVLGVEGKDAEDLARVSGVPGRQVGGHEFGGVESRLRRPFFAMEAASEFECGEDAQGLGEAQPRVARQRRGRGLREGEETALAQFTGEVEDALSG
jgi:hypothetical protein